MFLNELTSPEKQAFFALAQLVAQSDGIVSGEEEQLLNTYLHEMGMIEEEIQESSLSLQEITSIFNSQRSKNIALLEILSLVMADGVYSEEEETIVEQLKTAFHISEDKIEEYSSWLQRMSEVYAEGLQLLEEE